ncbi:hypothetical protein TNCV_4722361 [Trichonephila clavipes]|uniref:Uncharacterized protein n=1 Tax=Trichonephila clavipes TaxID=2585209 RepID=A0A8X6W6B6_TRICX|nr:hypothetical protein TNCV_4722361 [Trichonephila clavipes]
MSAPMFVKNARIQKAVTLINNLDSSKFPLLLTRILQKIHLKCQVSYTAWIAFGFGYPSNRDPNGVWSQLIQINDALLYIEYS